MNRIPQRRHLWMEASVLEPWTNEHKYNTDLVILRVQQLLKGIVAFEKSLHLISSVSESALLQEDLWRLDSCSHRLSNTAVRFSEAQRNAGAPPGSWKFCPCCSRLCKTPVLGGHLPTRTVSGSTAAPVCPVLPVGGPAYSAPKDPEPTLV